MRYPTPLLRGVLLQRYKRFLADIRLDSGEVITAHTPNTGTMLTCKDEGATAYVSPSDNPKRKLKFTWELVASNGGLVGVNTILANKLAEEAILAGRVAELAGYAHLRREVRYGENSRIDLLLENDNHKGGPLAFTDPEKAASPPCYVEVKSVTLGRDGVASFPDAVSTRATKHMKELAAQVKQGNRAAVLFVVQRMDCKLMIPADDIDPVYGAALREAASLGVQVLAMSARISPEAVELVTPLPVKL